MDYRMIPRTRVKSTIKNRKIKMTSSSGGAGDKGGADRLGAGGDGGADLLGVEVVVDQPVDDGRQLGLHQGLAGPLQAGEQLAIGGAQLFDIVNNLLLGGVAGDELVQVGDNVHAEAAQELVAGGAHRHPRQTRHRQQQQLGHSENVCMQFVQTASSNLPM